MLKRLVHCLCLSWSLIFLAAFILPLSAEQTALPGGFVYLRDVDPTIVQDIRYSTSHNFTGKVVAGYRAGECILLKKVAFALRAAQASLRPDGLSLKVFDCYRPKRAVRAFNAWVRQAEGKPGSKKFYYPRVRRRDLVKKGFIASRSTHSRGISVDVTLITLKPINNLDGSNHGSVVHGKTGCASSVEVDDYTPDMGTAFDCFDSKSFTYSTAITKRQRFWRRTLVRAMERSGFRNYRKEWWHFTFNHGRGAARDFPILPRNSPMR